MNLSLYCSFSPAHCPAPVLAAEQVLFTPWLEDVTTGQRATIRRTPAGNFDFAEAILALDASQTPDAVAVLLDERCASWPRELARLACPKVLLVPGAPRTPAGRAALAEYLRDESFDQVIGLGDRRSTLELRRLGAKNVGWLPGWHFPHSDESLSQGRKAQPQNRVALCADRQADDRAILGAAKAIALSGLTVHARVPPCRERPQIFGASALALVDGRPGDLRLLESLAVGVPSLCVRPEPDSGWEQVFPKDLVTPFGTADEAVDQAQCLLADPGEAHVIGEKAQRWFERSFSTARRRSLLASLIVDNRSAAEFELPTEAVTVSAAEPAAEPSAPDAEGERACELTERGELAAAFALASATLKRNPASWRSCLAIAEVAMETRKADLWRTILAQARALNPDDPHLVRLELGSRGLLVEWRAMGALAETWEACAVRDWKRAIERASAILRLYPQCAEAAYAAGYAGLQWARPEAGGLFTSESEHQPLTQAMRACGFPPAAVR